MSLKSLLFASILSLICCLFIFRIHTLRKANSMINWKTETVNKNHDLISNEHLTATVEFHKTEPAFARRPLTTYLIEVVSKNSSLNIGESFTLVNFILLFFCGIALCYTSKAILGDTALSNYNIIFFYLSFTVLFSFFPTNYSYDEPLQYILLFLSLTMLVKSKWILFIVYFTLSLVARESSILLLPAIALYLTGIEIKKAFRFENIQKILAITIPVLLYGVFLYLFISMTGIDKKSEADLTNRFSHFLFNFQNQEYAIESFFSLALAVGVHSYFLFNYISNNKLTVIEKKLIKAFLLTLILNTIVVLVSTAARETRLFALPLLFIWPIFGKIMVHEFKILVRPANYLKLVTNILPIGTLILLWALCFLNYRFIYWQTNGVVQNYLDEYLLVLSAVISLHFVMKTRLKQLENKTSL